MYNYISHFCFLYSNPPTFTSFKFMFSFSFIVIAGICICMHIYMPGYNLLRLYHVTCIHISRAAHLVLDNKLVLNWTSLIYFLKDFYINSGEHESFG